MVFFTVVRTKGFSSVCLLKATDADLNRELALTLLEVNLHLYTLLVLRTNWPKCTDVIFSGPRDKQKKNPELAALALMFCIFYNFILTIEPSGASDDIAHSRGGVLF